MDSRYADRLKLLETPEIEELYGRPRFNHDERVHFFGLTPGERAPADRHHALANRVPFILQTGCFKAKSLFFAFEFDEAREDARHVLDRCYPGGDAAELAAPVLKQTRHAQQRRILDLFGFRACQADERAALMEGAGQLVRVSPKPIFLFRNLPQYLEQRRIIVPGYSFLQDLAGQALAVERARPTGILDRHLDTATLKALDALYAARDGTYAIPPLKRDPKDFSLREMKREIARSQSLEPLYRAAEGLLPGLGLSNDSLAHYAALVDYHTAQKLRRLPADLARLYLLGFLLRRYRKINDNLVQALVYQVRL